MFAPITTFWPGFKQAANWMMKEDIHFQTVLPQAHTVSYEVVRLESGAERLKFSFGGNTGDAAYAEFLMSIQANEQRKKWPSTLDGLNALISRTVIERQARAIERVVSLAQASYRCSNREDRDLLREMIMEIGISRPAARDALLASIDEIELGSASKESARLVVNRA
jgi:hypothetical protein